MAWHRPLSNTFSSVGAKIVAALPSAQSIIPKGLTDGSVITSVTGGIRGPDPAASMPPSTSSVPLDADVAALFADRRAKVAVLKADGLRSLRAGNFRRAAELCGGWTDIEFGNAEAWRCLGDAQQGQGNYKEALAAYRKAKQHDPTDRSIDAAIDRSQKGIVGEFLNRNRK